MKKTILTIILSVAIAICATGCNETTSDSIPVNHASEGATAPIIISNPQISNDNQGLNCYLLSSSNSEIYNDGNEVKSASEQKWWNGQTFISTDSPKTRSIEFNNMTYEGNYKYSVFEEYNSFASDYYECPDGLEFAINHSNNEIVYLNLKTLSFFEEEPLKEDVIKSFDSGIELAKKTASEITDITGYALKGPSEFSYQPDRDAAPTMTLYTYTFDNEINNEESSAYISVQLTSKGNLASVSVGDIHAYADIEKASIRDSLQRKTDSLVKEAMKALISKGDANNSIERRYLAKTPDDSIVMCVRAVSTFNDQTKDGSSIPTSVGFEFIVK